MSAKPAILKNPIHFLAFGLGSGLSPKAPGTVGTIAAIPFYLFLQHLPLGQYLLLIAIASLVGIWLCGQTSKDLGVHDHPGIVWDEFCGFWITMIAAPSGWPWILLGFMLFRIFDIWKPWPIGWLDARVGGGFGIMADDIIAGFYALALLQAAAYLGGVLN
ncbi:phosphatidylglycerophosphatase A [Endozoicomonas sp. Mp262]|uniref:phosphatidylglycerophosphatase A family protein n=1 Tax=Endozoicomonas sp. Mp262 TaxID=2919499 RepID=UPI0021DB5E58